ncbi:MAG: hypothetical protein N4A43_05255 [Alphaproteobacteria bacterium]|jgi:hypothetical protein|nr:hypothetical protein [Alphaproteobacteria bacterium]
MRKNKLYILLFIIFTAFIIVHLFGNYAISVIPTTIYNTEDLYKAYEIKDNKLIARDKSSLVREIEAQTFPGTVWKIAEKIKVNNIKLYKAQTPEYWNTPKDFYFYIDARSVKTKFIKPRARKLILPNKEELLEKLNEIKKQTQKELIPYIWGGNTLQGINENEKFYSRGKDLSKLNKQDKKQFFLQGLDCTGLLYYITDGYTPRNSSWLRTFGDPVGIEDKSIDDIIKMVKPLDIIVHQGHIVLILNSEETIESRLSKGGGVVITPIRERFEELFETKVPLNHAPLGKSENSWFVIRRFVK